jgi:RNA polymerase sigma-70 factor (family 1)
VTELSEIKLAEDFRNGDERAFKEVFERFYRPVTLFAFGIIKNKSEAEDIAVSTMGKLWRIHKNFDSVVNIKAFVYITARNACLDYLKKVKRDDLIASEFGNIVSDSDDFVLSRMIQHEIFEQLRHEINSLSPQRREVMMMSFYQKMPAREIARRMNISVNTVRNTKAQGIKQLRELLARKKILAFVLFSFLSAITG